MSEASDDDLDRLATAGVDALFEDPAHAVELFDAAHAIAVRTRQMEKAGTLSMYLARAWMRRRRTTRAVASCRRSIGEWLAADYDPFETLASLYAEVANRSEETGHSRRALLLFRAAASAYRASFVMTGSPWSEARDRVMTEAARVCERRVGTD